MRKEAGKYVRRANLLFCPYRTHVRLAAGTDARNACSLTLTHDASCTPRFHQPVISPTPDPDSHASTTATASSP